MGALVLVATTFKAFSGIFRVWMLSASFIDSPRILFGTDESTHQFVLHILVCVLPSFHFGFFENRQSTCYNMA
jgi:hypothetical protein